MRSKSFLSYLLLACALLALVLGGQRGGVLTFFGSEDAEEVEERTEREVEEEPRLLEEECEEELAEERGSPSRRSEERPGAIRARCVPLPASPALDAWIRPQRC